jgi:hypothetical protein
MLFISREELKYPDRQAAEASATSKTTAGAASPLASPALNRTPANGSSGAPLSALGPVGRVGITVDAKVRCQQKISVNAAFVSGIIFLLRAFAPS